MAWNEGKAFEAALSFERGEEKGFEFFFNELYYQLNHHAFGIVNDRQSAEDAVETSFIKLWERREGFVHPKVIKAWLYTTVKNDCLNRLQRFKEKEMRNKELIPMTPVISGIREDEIIKTEIYAQLHIYINELPKACRAIFKSLFFEGLSVNEISEKSGLSISTVKNQKARGLILLRKKYNVSKQSIEEKKYRWLKSVFYNTHSHRARAKLYGISDNIIALIRSGDIYPKITKQFS